MSDDYIGRFNCCRDAGKRPLGQGQGFRQVANISGLETLNAMPELKNVKTWTEHLGRSKLRSFTDTEGHFWLEQNAAKDSKWAKLAREGHEIAWEFDGPGGSYTGRVLIDGEIYTSREAAKKFSPPS